FHRAGPAVQEGHVFRASPESPPEPALPGDTPGPFGLRVRSMRDGGGNGFLVSVAGGRGALLVLGGIPEGAEEILVSVSGGTALLTAAGRPSGQGPLPAFLERLLRVTPSLLAAVPRKDGGLRV